MVAEKIGKNAIAATGYLFLFLSCSSVLAGFYHSGFYYPAFLFLGLFMAFSDATQRAIASDLSKSIGFGLGAFHFVFGTSILLANILYGYLLGFNPALIFKISGALALASAIIYFLHPVFRKN